MGLGSLPPLVHQAAPTTLRTQPAIARLAIVAAGSLELLLGLLDLLLLAHVYSFLVIRSSRSSLEDHASSSSRPKLEPEQSCLPLPRWQ